MRARGDTPDAKVALAELCDAYYQPVLRFLRREGRAEDAARELTQEFFARLLARGGIAGVDPVRGRFRSFLLGALRHFLADQRQHEQRLKRGGGVAPESLDASSDTQSSPALPVADPQAAVPDTYFDREWALSLMDRSLAALQHEFEQEGKGVQYEALKPWLVGEAAALVQADAARRLAVSEGAVKVMIHRLRKRFRELIRAEIIHTVPDPAEVDTELRYLVEVLVSSPPEPPTEP